MNLSKNITSEPIDGCDLPPDIIALASPLHLNAKIIYPSISILGFIFYAIVMTPVIIGRFRKKYTNSFYCFAIGIAVCELIDLSSCFYIGLCQWIGECPGHPSSALWNLYWWEYYANCFLHLFTAWNRCCCVFFYSKQDDLFEMKYMIFYFAFAAGAAALTNFYGFKFGLKYCTNFGYSWFDDDALTPTQQQKFFWIDTSANYVCYGLVFVLYAAAFIVMRMTHSKISGAASNGGNINGNKKERRFLYQGCLITIPSLLFVSTYQISNNIPSLAAAMGIANSVLQIVRLTINPIVYPWFNKGLRNDVCNMFIWNAPNEVATSHYNVQAENRVSRVKNVTNNQPDEMKLPGAAQ